jgi:predicted nucleotidyltransferase component of viral defense system
MSHGQRNAALLGSDVMTSKQSRDMPASVRARLLNVAKLNNEAFDLVLVRFAIERLLYRLSQSQYRERFVVKGATMFQIWSNLRHRPTRDLDLLGTGEPDVDRFVEIFRGLCVQEVENDGLVFVADSVSATKMKEDEEYEGIRIKFDAFLGSARIPVQVDIGFGDAITPSSQLIVFPTVLDLPAPQLQSYPRETVVAEKFQAMVMLGIANSRMKDFFDLFTLCTQFEFEGELVRRAINATFERRKTSIPTTLPLALTTDFSEDKQKSLQWNAFLRKTNLNSNELTLSEITARLANFLMPPAEAASQGRQLGKYWRPSDGWIEGGE